MLCRLHLFEIVNTSQGSYEIPKLFLFLGLKTESIPGFGASDSAIQ